VQRCLVANKRLLVLESKTSLKDIPFSERFYVLERWLITSQKREDRYVSSMSVSCQVVFTQGCPFEKTIVTKSQETVAEIALQWNEMAQAALRKTEQARQERLKQDNEENGVADNEVRKSPKTASVGGNDIDTSIEVERMSRTVSRIIGQTDDESISITTAEVIKPPPDLSAGKNSLRGKTVRRSLSRSFSNMMKRRKSHPQ